MVKFIITYMDSSSEVIEARWAFLNTESNRLRIAEKNEGRPRHIYGVKMLEIGELVK